MNYNDYLRRYNYAMRHLRALGNPYPGKCWWKLSKYNKTEFRQNQIKDMWRVIRQQRQWRKEAQAG